MSFSSLASGLPKPPPPKSNEKPNGKPKGGTKPGVKGVIGLPKGLRPPPPPSISEGGDRVDPKFLPAMKVEQLAKTSFAPTTAADFSAIADRYRSALQGLNASELAAQRSQMSEEINAQTLAAQRQMRALQGQQGIRGGVAQAGMAQIAQQGQKAVAGTERDLLIRNQQIQQQALSNFNDFMQGERGQRLAGMLTSSDMSQKAAADIEMKGILQQYLQAAQAQTAGGPPGSGGGGKPWWQKPNEWWGMTVEGVGNPSSWRW